mmetsp:Transcript_9959/g.32640  ORF Transcript_9959/g.32640 Transcript_9959/m.32640 type:complete len:326 (-) Transcript_9959:187-1164(-)
MDPYRVLGVGRNASLQEVKAAWRKAAKAAHPDMHASGGEKVREAAEKKFRELAAAYEVLSARHSAGGAAGAGAGGRGYNNRSGPGDFNRYSTSYQWGTPEEEAAYQRWRAMNDDSTFDALRTGLRVAAYGLGFSVFYLSVCHDSVSRAFGRATGFGSKGFAASGAESADARRSSSGARASTASSTGAGNSSRRNSPRPDKISKGAAKAFGLHHPELQPVALSRERVPIYRAQEDAGPDGSGGGAGAGTGERVITYTGPDLRRRMMEHLTDGEGAIPGWEGVTASHWRDHPPPQGRGIYRRARPFRGHNAPKAAGPPPEHSPSTPA